MINKRIKETLIVGHGTPTPSAIKVGFTQPLDPYDRIRTHHILMYWAESNAICKPDGNVIVRWDVDITTALVMGEFDRGGFNGDMTHRDAIGWGDESFTIGLTRLFYEGQDGSEKRQQLIPPIFPPAFISIERTPIQIFEVPIEADEIATHLSAAEDLNDIQAKKILALEGEKVLLTKALEDGNEKIEEYRNAFRNTSRESTERRLMIVELQGKITELRTILETVHSTIKGELCQ